MRTHWRHLHCASSEVPSQFAWRACGQVLERSPAGHVHARRILLKASNGVVAGNTFTEPKFIAAQITPEFYFQVRNND